MNEHEARALAHRLNAAGFELDVIVSMNRPPETAWSISAYSLDADGNAWMFVHVREPHEASALLDSIRIIGQQDGEAVITGAAMPPGAARGTASAKPDLDNLTRPLTGTGLDPARFHTRGREGLP